jgi:hypothetical protein
MSLADAFEDPDAHFDEDDDDDGSGAEDVEEDEEEEGENNDEEEEEQEEDIDPEEAALTKELWMACSRGDLDLAKDCISRGITF